MGLPPLHLPKRRVAGCQCCHFGKRTPQAGFFDMQNPPAGCHDLASRRRVISAKNNFLIWPARSMPVRFPRPTNASLSGRMLIAARNLLAQRHHQPLCTRGAAACDRLDGISNGMRFPFRQLANRIILRHTAAKQGCQRHPKRLCNLRKQLQRRRTLSALQPAKVQLGDSQFFSRLFLRHI